MVNTVHPHYIELFKSGELKKRADILESRLLACDICPRKCGINRKENQYGFCHSGNLPIVSSVCDHHGEEPPLSGTKGSGAIFFGNCNLRCVFCQNYQISQNWEIQKENEISIEQLAKNMLFLQDELGCHNINLVSPTHFGPQIVKSLLIAIPAGLKIPLVYNTNAYDSVETLRLLDGLIDIYLPDIKYADDAAAEKYSSAPDYVRYSRDAISEMFRQVGNLTTDDGEIAIRGIIVRHLILPGGLAGSKDSLRWLADTITPDIAISIMSQYNPLNRAANYPPLDRVISEEEYDFVEDLIEGLAMENGWVQQIGSEDSYTPDFNREGHPFIDNLN
jgi:putative pyruvate formate lyase activating enzyme